MNNTYPQCQCNQAMPVQSSNASAMRACQCNQAMQVQSSNASAIKQCQCNQAIHTRNASGHQTSPRRPVCHSLTTAHTPPRPRHGGRPRSRRMQSRRRAVSGRGWRGRAGMRPNAVCGLWSTMGRRGPGANTSSDREALRRPVLVRDDHARSLRGAADGMLGLVSLWSILEARRVECWGWCPSGAYGGGVVITKEVDIEGIYQSRYDRDTIEIPSRYDHIDERQTSCRLL